MTITLTGTIRSTGRDNITFADSITVDAVDEIVVDVDHGAADQLITMSPGSAALTKFVYISSNTYPATVGTPNLSYKANVAAPPVITLSTFQIWGPDMDAVTAGLDKIYASNSHAATDTTWTILVGRDVV